METEGEAVVTRFTGNDEGMGNRGLGKETAKRSTWKEADMVSS